MFGRRKTLALSITLVATLALGISAYLTWVIWQSGTVVGCSADSLLDCDDVLSSRWSKWLGLPVSLLGALTYLLILILGWPALRASKLAVTGLFALAMVAAGAAVWFVGLQAIQLQSFCFYCLTVHACGLTVGVLALMLFLEPTGIGRPVQTQSLFGTTDTKVDLPEVTSSLDGRHLGAALAFSAVGLSALMGGQLLSEPVETMSMEEVEFQLPEDQPPATVESVPSVDAQDENDFVITTDQTADAKGGLGETSENALLSADPPGSDPQAAAALLGTGTRNLAYKSLPYLVDVNALPRVGSSEAPHVMIEMMDYTCKHCRELHPHLLATLDHYGGQLAFAIHHVPLSKQCNPHVQKDRPGTSNACDYARLAIGVWKLAPEKFPEFHDWLLESKKPPGVSRAKERAMNLVGGEILLSKPLRAKTNKRIATQCATLEGLKTGLPVMLLPEGAIRGVPDQSQKLFDYLESKLGVEPR